MDGNELAAQFIGDTRWNGLPDAVLHKVKMCLVDIIAAVDVQRTRREVSASEWLADVKRRNPEM